MFRRLEPTRATAVTITLADAPLVARAGDSVAAALLAHGHLVFGRDADGSARAPLCLVGNCQRCRLTVDGVEQVLACMTPVREGMRVELPAADDVAPETGR